MEYKLIVGLGNPGEKYRHTRHNIGFMAIDQIAKRLNISDCHNKFRSDCMITEYLAYKLILLKPQTYMNNSGIAVRECVTFYKISTRDIMVIHDELDLERGRIKIKRNGGDGGHNGLKSIDQAIGKDYYRLRFGIAKPSNASEIISDYVLNTFTSSEMGAINCGLNFLAEHFDFLANGRHDTFLNAYNIIRKQQENTNGI